MEDGSESYTLSVSFPFFLDMFRCSPKKDKFRFVSRMARLWNYGARKVVENYFNLNYLVIVTGYILYLFICLVLVLVLVP
jgi:hypothetical protein